MVFLSFPPHWTRLVRPPSVLLVAWPKVLPSVALCLKKRATPVSSLASVREHV